MDFGEQPVSSFVKVPAVCGGEHKAMITLNLKHCDPKIFKEALTNVLNRKEYHQAPPTKKNEMILKEYARILDKKKQDRK